MSNDPQLLTAGEYIREIRAAFDRWSSLEDEPRAPTAAEQFIDETVRKNLAAVALEIANLPECGGSISCDVHTEERLQGRLSIRSDCFGEVDLRAEAMRGNVRLTIERNGKVVERRTVRRDEFGNDESQRTLRAWFIGVVVKVLKQRAAAWRKHDVRTKKDGES